MLFARERGRTWKLSPEEKLAAEVGRIRDNLVDEIRARFEQVSASVKTFADALDCFVSAAEGLDPRIAAVEARTAEFETLKQKISDLETRITNIEKPIADR